MRHQWLTRIVRAAAVPLLLVLAVPSASSAWVFAGTQRVTAVCYGEPATTYVTPFAVEMETGAGFGQITTSVGSFEVITDWFLDGKVSYFSASNATPGVATVVYSGVIKNGKLKGHFVEHGFLGCIFTGSLSATLQPLQ